jgi:hypothetical protein
MGLRYRLRPDESGGGGAGACCVPEAAPCGIAVDLEPGAQPDPSRAHSRTEPGAQPDPVLFAAETAISGLARLIFSEITCRIPLVERISRHRRLRKIFLWLAALTWGYSQCEHDPTLSKH